ncbi:UNVERIFIED_ORG: hypothetical protein CLV66_1071 [Actinomadura viridilutea]
MGGRPAAGRRAFCFSWCFLGLVGVLRLVLVGGGVRSWLVIRVLACRRSRGVVGALSCVASEVVNGVSGGYGVDLFVWGAALLFAATGRHPLRPGPRGCPQRPPDHGPSLSAPARHASAISRSQRRTHPVEPPSGRRGQISSPVRTESRSPAWSGNPGGARHTPDPKCRGDDHVKARRSVVGLKTRETTGPRRLLLARPESARLHGGGLESESSV